MNCLGQPAQTGCALWLQLGVPVPSTHCLTSDIYMKNLVLALWPQKAQKRPHLKFAPMNLERTTSASAKMSSSMAMQPILSHLTDLGTNSSYRDLLILLLSLRKQALILQGVVGQGH